MLDGDDLSESCNLKYLDYYLNIGVLTKEEDAQLQHVLSWQPCSALSGRCYINLKDLHAAEKIIKLQLLTTYRTTSSVEDHISIIESTF